MKIEPMSDTRIAEFHWIYISPASIETTKALARAAQADALRQVVKALEPYRHIMPMGVFHQLESELSELEKETT